ncbi:Alpha/beta hydrolase fold-3 [Cordyceps fumosorosea ARSEF 2679]|uniref:Alpha/beta hydrolase fold-3 n=1 Tax=Cordyceps fumosorosea (strain ARSEF 2679) TaxID=1081104 RepID=A0A167WKF4_CORFA|nr:Alpha/beta hydrolase fold-3 [Cordyceps fumosorosea ARSEF 2679]OAA63904.1 Alpha/beta hydrolase fold-3 [Cordyceps fumosorosea ARSEF 2679]
MITEEDLEIIGAQPLTAWDKVKIVGIVFLYPIVFAYQLARFLLPHHPQRALHWRQKALLAGIHAANAFRSQKRITYAAGHARTTNASLRAYAAKHRAHGLEHREVLAPVDPASSSNPATGQPVPPPTLHFFSGPWLADTPGAGPVVLYAHGGGYLEPLVPSAHVPLARGVARGCAARSLVFLTYALCPAAQYPAQLVQGVAALRHLLDVERVRPGDLVLAGDSAGAHLMASLLAHAIEPSPSAPPLCFGGEQLRAAVLLSPWFTWTDAASLGASECDFLDGADVARRVTVLRPRVDEVWCEVVAAEGARQVWERVFATTDEAECGKPLVKRLLVTASDSEIMYRDAKVFAVEYAGATIVVVGGEGKDEADMKARLAVVESEARVFAVGVREAHVQPGLDEAVGYHGDGTWRALQTFMSSLRD